MTTEPLRYYSTNRGVAPVTLREALLCGQAADRGLFLPERLPTLTPATLAALAGRPYAEVAWEVLRPFTAGMVAEDRLRELCADAYSYDVPLEPVVGRRHLLRLDRGPTASFKDFAARMMARWMGQLLADDAGMAGQDLVILTATSGDTGSAVAHAYYRVPGIRIVVLFPEGEVSTRQRKQMTTLGENVTTYGVAGKFDDCQAMVKRAFADPALGGIRLSSANSINIGRLLPQTVYYVYAYARLARGGEPIVFSVPSGNFGDMMGAILAQRMGVPIARVIIATNANDEVPRFLERGVYEKIVPSRVCLSNAMNVGHPSNLARLVDVYGGQMDETGVVRVAPDMERMRRDLWAVSIDDETTRTTIRDAWARHQVLLEPHGAVGWAGLERYLAAHPEEAERLTVAVETAHPAKFPEEIRALLDLDPPVPPSLAGLEERPEQYDRLTADYEPFRDLLLRRFGA
jgi:threonine synthase